MLKLYILPSTDDYVRSIHTHMSHIQEWSPELADIAQAFSEQRTQSSNIYRHVQSTTFNNVGENHFYGAEGQNYSLVIDIWYGERKHYDYDTNTCAARCDNYTQVS